MNRNLKRVIAVSLVALGLAVGLSGCGTDKFEGDWTGTDGDDVLYQVHIQKNGNNYLVNDDQYYYKGKKKPTDRKTDILYNRVPDLILYHARKGAVDPFTGEKRDNPEYARYEDYTYVLKDDHTLKSAPGTVNKNSNTLRAGQTNQTPVTFTYIEKDKTLQAAYPGHFDVMTLKQAKKDDINTWMEGVKKKIKDELTATDEELRAKLNPDYDALGTVYVLGDVNFDDSVLQQQQKQSKK